MLKMNCIPATTLGTRSSVASEDETSVMSSWRTKKKLVRFAELLIRVCI